MSQVGRFPNLKPFGPLSLSTISCCGLLPSDTSGLASLLGRANPSRSLVGLMVASIYLGYSAATPKVDHRPPAPSTPNSVLHRSDTANIHSILHVGIQSHTYGTNEIGFEIQVPPNTTYCCFGCVLFVSSRENLLPNVLRPTLGLVNPNKPVKTNIQQKSPPNVDL